jgi:hypothetical protein
MNKQRVSQATAHTAGVKTLSSLIQKIIKYVHVTPTKYTGTHVIGERIL